MRAADELDAFLAAARAFISLADELASPEQAKELDRKELVALESVLANLHAAFLSLPHAAWVDVEDEKDLADFRSPVHSFYRDFRKRLGQQDSYYSTAGHTVVGRSVADDLADIKWELEAFLVGLASGASSPQLQWELHLSFWTHWGVHLVGAVERIHELAIEAGAGFGDP